MESIRKAPGAILASSARTFINGAMWILDYFYIFAGSFVFRAPNLREELVNFTLSFPNGEEQGIVFIHHYNCRVRRATRECEGEPGETKWYRSAPSKATQEPQSWKYFRSVVQVKTERGSPRLLDKVCLLYSCAPMLKAWKSKRVCPAIVIRLGLAGTIVK